MLISANGAVVVSTANVPTNAAYSGGIAFDPVTGAMFVSSSVGALSTANTAAAAAANVTAIQAALTAGGLVQITTPGTYYINNTLVLYSNTKLVIGKGVTLKLFAGTVKSLIATNSYVNGTGTSISLAWTSGNLITVGWTAHGLVRGNHFVITGATAATRAQYNTTYVVHSVTDANTVTAYTVRPPTSAASIGTPLAWRCTENFSISGGGTLDFDYENNNGDQTTMQNVTALLLGRAALFEVDDITILNINKFGGHCGACMDFSVTNVKMYAPTGATAGAEGWSTFGPCRNGSYENMRGRFTDDGMSCQASPDVTYSYATWTGGGDVDNMRWKGIYLESSGAQGICMCITDQYQITDRCYWEDINGISTAAVNSSIFALNKNISQSSGLFGTIEVNGVHGFLPGSGLRAVYCSAGGAVVGNRFMVRDVDALSDGPQVYLGTNFTTNITEIEDVVHNVITTTSEAVVLQNPALQKKVIIRRVQSALAADSAAYVIQVSSGGSPDLTIEDCLVSGAGANRRFLLTINSTAGTTRLRRNTVVTSGTTLLQCQQAASGTVYELDQNICDGTAPFAFNAGASSITATVNARGNQTSSNSLGFIRTATSGTIVTLSITSDGSNIIGNSAHITVATGTAALTVKALDIKVDPIALTSLAATVGQYLFSTQASTEGGPAILTPAGWVALGTGASGVNTVIT